MDPVPATTDLLHPDEDAELQEMVREAADALGAPIALVSLVLDQIQFFKAHYGLPPELRLTRATRRDVSFCQYVVQSGDLFQVTDAAAGDPVASMLADTHQIGSYLGVPISVENQIIGSLCVLDVVPREFTAAEREALATRVGAVSRRLEELLRIRRRRLQRGAMLQSLADAFPGADVSALARHAREAIQVLSAHARLAQADVPPAANLAALQLLPDLQETEAALVQLLAGIEKHHLDLAERLESLAVLSRSAGATCDLAEVIEASIRLGRANTDPIGGVIWVFDARPMRVAVAPDALLPGLVGCLGSLAAALMDHHLDGPIELHTTDGPLGWRVSLVPPAASRIALDGIDVGPLQIERSLVDRTDCALFVDLPRLERADPCVVPFRAHSGGRR